MHVKQWVSDLKLWVGHALVWWGLGAAKSPTPVPRFTQPPFIYYRQDNQLMGFIWPFCPQWNWWISPGREKVCWQCDTVLRCLYCLDLTSYFPQVCHLRWTFWHSQNMHSEMGVRDQPLINGRIHAHWSCFLSSLESRRLPESWHFIPKAERKNREQAGGSLWVAFSWHRAM